MKRFTVLCAAAAAVAMLAAGPAPAKPKPKPRGATFQLQIKGEQLTTWKYTKQVAPSCDWPEGATGRQYITFGTYSSGDSARPKVKVKPAKGGGVELKFVRKNVTLEADAELKASADRLFSQQSDCPGGGSNGGEGPPSDLHENAHCEAIGDLDFYFGSSIEEVEHESYPTDLAGKKAPRAPLFFAADPFWVNSQASEKNLPSACEAQGMPNADIGITESQGEWAGALIPVGGSLPAAKLLRGKAKKTVVNLGRTVAYPNAVQKWGGPEHTTGRTRIDLTLTFKRLG